MTITEYHWQLIFYSDKSVACAFSVEHEGQPTNDEVESSCTVQQLNAWRNTPTCDKTLAPNGKCTGLYLHNVNSNPIYKNVQVKLSPPMVWVSLIGCDYSGADEYCQGKPKLLFIGEEPLPNEKIIEIQGKINGEEFKCSGDQCIVELSSTTATGMAITFMGDSSFGDSTETFSALVRVVPVEGMADGYYVDVISDQWMGKSPPSCSEIWQVFPESIDLPNWLDTPASPVDLRSSQNLYYLAAALIKNGVVNAGSCEDGGLANAYTANECGVTLAGPKAQYWQNQFDEEILTVANMDGIPANLIKNIFMRESQLWPGVYKKIQEVGFGQLTENGADTALLWNQEFYEGFCPLVLDESICTMSFAQLSQERQDILKGALLRRTNAACADCENGIDLTKANFSIHIFAETIKANCSQVNQVIKNTTGKSAREVSSYTDLWRFTLLNYNAGAGCLSNAIYTTNSAGSPIDWKHVAANLPANCQSAASYVVDVSGGNTEKITGFSTPQPTITPTGQETATMTATPTAAITPTEISSIEAPTAQTQTANTGETPIVP